jgi:tetratricopeptide (TPR) repeat protein
MLANIFDVTTDMLLGVELNVKDLRLVTIRKEAQDYTWTKQYDKAEKLLRNGLKEYPNSYSLMNELASTLSVSVSIYKKDWNEEEKERIKEERKPIWDEIIALSEKILAECTDDDHIRHSSIQYLCNAYVAMDETEKAASFAKKMPFKAYARENLIIQTLKGTAKFKHIQRQMAYSALGVLDSVATLMGISLDDESEPYDTDERIELHHKIIDIINILIEKGSFGDFNFRLMDAHQRLSSLYIKKNDADAALNHFRLAAKHAVLYDAMPPVNDNFNKEYTNLLFRGITFPFNMVHTPYTMSEHVLEKSCELDSVVPASELEEIRNELRKHTDK